MVLLAHAAPALAGDVVAVAAVVVAVAVFVRGGASRTRLAAFTAGAVVLAIALAPSVDAAADGSFTQHMAQHLALTVVAAPLLVLARPIPVLARALPRAAPLLVGTERALTPPTRRAEVALAVGWCAAFVAAFWAWHVPVAYEAALRHDALHVGQHASYVVTALGFWWTALGPLRRRQPLLVGALLFTATVQGVLAILVFAFARRVDYPSYEANGVADIQAGGALMALSGIVYVVAAVVVLGTWLARVEQAAAVPQGARR